MMNAIVTCVIALLLLANIPIANSSECNGGAILNSMMDSFTIGTHFTLNKGQLSNPEIIFHSENAYFTPTGIIFRLMEHKGRMSDLDRKFITSGKTPLVVPPKMQIIKETFLGANPVIPYGKDKLQEKSFFFLGNDSSKWMTDTPNYREIIYENLYNSIDLVYREVQNGIKYEFIVHPGGNVKDIKIKYDGAKITTDGKNVSISAPAGTIVDGGLFSYEITEGRHIDVSSEIVIKDQVMMYKIEYDHRYTLVIDPIIYSSYFGGTYWDDATSITVDSQKNIYLTGYTYSQDFPTTSGTYQQSLKGDTDVFISKFNANGHDLLFSTYIGGSNYDESSSIKLDSTNNIVVGGYTRSLDFPATSKAYDQTFSGWDAYILKLSSQGNSLVFSTALGGMYAENDCRLDVDSNGSIYITGDTTSPDFPITSGAYDSTLNGNQDIFITKMNSSGDKLIFSTFVGGSLSEYPGSITVDNNNRTFITGYTLSSDFPTTFGAFDTTFNGGNADAFVFELNADGNALVFSTYLGGKSSDAGREICIDSSNNVFIVGETQSDDFPNTSGAFDNTFNGKTDLFALKLSSDGNTLDFSTFIGGKENDYQPVIAVDGSDDLCVAAMTQSPDFPLTPSADDTFKKYSALMKIKSDGTLVFSSFLANGFSNSMAIDSDNVLYLTGWTSDSNFPITSDAYDKALNGIENGFIMKYRMPMEPSAPRNLTAKQGDRFTILNWTPPVFNGFKNITNYIVNKGLQANNLSMSMMIGNVTLYNDTGLINGQKYFYSISAVNSMGEGNRSAVINYTAGTYPTLPTYLKAVVGDSFVNLSWTPPYDSKGFAVSNYSIFRGLNNTTIPFYKSIGNFTTFNDTDVTNGNQYYYQVTAKNERGESEHSNIIRTLPATVPSIPTDLTAMEGDGYIFLSWNPPIYDGGLPVSLYRVYKTDQSVQTNIGETGDLTWNTTEVVNGISCLFSVSAVNSMGEGNRTDEVTAMPGILPDAPELTLSADNGKVLVTWRLGYSGGLPIIQYYLYRADTAGKEPTIIANVGKNSYSDLSVLNEITYYYAVSAVNLKGEGKKSTVLSATPTGEGRLPGAPVNLTGEAGNGYVLISWLAPLDSGGLREIGYRIYKGEDKDSLSFLINTSGLLFNETRAQNGVTYYYAVTSVNAIGEGDRSPVISVTPKGVGRIPSAPLDFSVERDNSSISLKWNEPTSYGGSKIRGYSIYKGTESTNLILLTNTSDLFHMDSQWEYGIRYYYTVAAVNEKGESPSSEMKEITIYDVPSEVYNVTATTGYNFVLLDWQAPKLDGGYKIKEYQIYRAQGKGTMSLFSSVKEIRFNDTKVSNGFNYSYKIAAVNDLGMGKLSEIINATPGAPPGMPLNLKVGMENGRVRLKWDSPENKGGFAILEYRIYRGSSEKDMKFLALVKEPTFLDNKVMDGQKYYYRISAVNERGEGPSSDINSITVPESVFIDTGIAIMISVAVIVIVAITASLVLISRRRASKSKNVKNEENEEE